MVRELFELRHIMVVILTRSEVFHERLLVTDEVLKQVGHALMVLVRPVG